MCSKLTSHIIILIALICLPYKFLEARLMKLDELDATSEQYSEDIKIYKNGTTVRIVNMRLKANTDSGRQALSSFPIHYDARDSTIELIAARTLDGHQNLDVPKSSIEDKSVASSQDTFSDMRKLTVAYPNVTVGTEVELSYRMTTRNDKALSFPQFSEDLFYNYATNTDYELNIDSELPLRYQVIDQDHAIDIKETKTPTTHTIKVRLKKPTLKLLKNEDRGTLSPYEQPCIRITSLGSWREMGDVIGTQYQSVLEAPLPPFMLSIAEASAKKGHIWNQVNEVTSRLNDAISYMSDTRTTRSAYFPKSFKDLDSSRQGDCKDFSSATVAILRHLGLEAHPVWIWRGEQHYPSPFTLPGLAFEINHALVCVVYEGREYFIDPTNSISYSPNIFPDISNRRALVFKPDGMILSQTPALEPQDTVTTQLEQSSLSSDGIKKTQGQISLTGHRALPITGLDRDRSKIDSDHQAIELVKDENSLIHWSVTHAPWRDRIVEPKSMQYKYETYEGQIETTEGSSYLVKNNSFRSVYLDLGTGFVGDLNVMDPQIVNYNEVLLNRKIKNAKKHQCEFSSPWLDGGLEIKDSKHGIEINRHLVIKTNRISNKDLKSQAYTEFTKNLRSCLKDIAIIHEGL